MPKAFAVTQPDMPFRKLFLSRWSALIWAAGILWTAADVAGVSPSVLPDNAATASTGDPELDNDIALFNSVMAGK